ncbi:hypothetical protein POM88_028083 [Heracleum sosnowskyi]|uniref:HMG box domain-containing protein n=1 Tax=Heracleum sosnowskyi TaxID=360622 RepID=A0AAD8I933_9APIA|nr:hypothetical protein POM88_028083 [Heracleum sosnowskyi]
MAPEYAMYGQFSFKSDVFSFGILVLEIVSGQKNKCFGYGENVEDLASSIGKAGGDRWRAMSDEDKAQFVTIAEQRKKDYEKKMQAYEKKQSWNFKCCWRSVLVFWTSNVDDNLLLFDRGFPVVGQCVEIGVPMLILFVAFSQYLKHLQTKQVPILERFALLISVAVIWAYAHLLTASGAYKHHPEETQMHCRTDKANLIDSAPWIKIPYPLQWGAPTFDAGHAFGMMAAVIVSLIESTGAYKAASRLASATPPPAHVLSRGIGWQGIGILLDGLFGTLTGSTVSVENVGLLGSTRVGSRRVVQISAGFMIFFAILGKFGALFASIPFTIFAAIYCVLFGLVGKFL